VRILAVDVGTGTQDILLFDSSSMVENCVKMIMPSPTALVAQRIVAATKRRWPILMEGVTMGGGPCKGALSRHTAAGLAAYATEEAALTFHDDLDVVKGMGVTIVSPDEVLARHKFEVIKLRDFDLAAIRGALQSFGVDSRFDGVAVARARSRLCAKGGLQSPLPLPVPATADGREQHSRCLRSSGGGIAGPPDEDEGGSQVG
jgi:uncharacterized protein (DUF1786 family)